MRRYWVAPDSPRWPAVGQRLTGLIQTREGKIYCCTVLDAFSRKIVGWSIDNCQDSSLVVNALDMAIKDRNPAPGGNPRICVSESPARNPE